MIKIAVLISTYNGEKYIKDQIESIIAQKVDAHIDIIVRDDGSSDKTKEILEDYSKQNKLIWYTGKNLKPANSFFDLLAHNKLYDYYAFADQDDYWKDDKLQRAIEKIHKYNEPVLYFSNAEVVDENLVGKESLVYKQLPSIDLRSLSCGGGLLGCTMVFNSALATVIQSNEKPYNVIMHDYYLAVVCAAIDGKIVYDNTPTMYYRQHSNNVVGVARGPVKKIKGYINSLTNMKYDFSIAEQADAIVGLYSEHISEENKIWLTKVASCDKNVITRLRIAMNPQVNYASLLRGCKVRLSILFGNR